MNYHFSKTVDYNFEEAIVRVTEELNKEGFGIITEIDIKKVLKEKLNKDFRQYIIIGACNPSIAYSAIMAEDKIGTLMPCNIVVQEHLTVILKYQLLILFLIYSHFEVKSFQKSSLM